MLNSPEQIYEVDNFASILEYVDENTLVALDLDDTLWTYGHMLGTDAWYEQYSKNKVANKGMTPTEARLATLNKAILVKAAVTDLMPVEPGIPEIIRSFQERNIQVLGLTSRGAYHIKTTQSQFRHPKINLDLNRGKFENVNFGLENFSEAELYQGTIYTSGQHKGVALMEVLYRLNYFPNVVFIDDKRHNLDRVRESIQAANRNMSFVGLRYGYLDHRVANFELPVAKTQLNLFKQLNHIVTDELAKKIGSYENTIKEAEKDTASNPNLRRFSF